MNLQQIIDHARHKLNNYEKPYYWVDSELVHYCNETCNIMCRDGKVITDSFTSSCCEIHTAAGVMDYLLSTAVIFVLSANIVTKELMTLDTAPATAWVVGDTITGSDSAVTSSVLEKLTDYTYVVEKRTGTYTLGETLSNGTYTAHQSSTYPKLTDYESSELTKTDYSEMNSRHNGGWRTYDAAQPFKYLLDFSEGYLSVYPKPDDIYLLRMSVNRYPVADLTTTLMSSQTPEVPAKYHETLINGICSMAYMKRGENTFDEKLAAIYNNIFYRELGKEKLINNLSRDRDETIRIKKGFI